MSLSLENKKKIKEAAKEALENAGKILIGQSEYLSEDIAYNNVSEIYVTIRIENDGTPYMDVTKTYMPL